MFIEFFTVDNWEVGNPTSQLGVRATSQLLCNCKWTYKTFLFQRLPLELLLLQDYNLCDTLFSSIFVNEEKFGPKYIGLVKETICVARETFFWAPRWQNLVQMAASLLLAHQRMPMHMCKEKFHHRFPFNSRQLMPVKTVAIFDELLKDVLQCHCLVLQKVKLVFTLYNSHHCIAFLEKCTFS